MRNGLVSRHPWLLLSAACLVPAVLDVLQGYVQGRLNPENAMPWRWQLWSAFEWIILGALIPITYFLGRRYPLRQPHVARHLVVHALGALVLCIGWAGIGITFGMLLGTVPATVASWMLRTIPWGVFMYFTTLGCVHALNYFAEVREREAQAARLAAQVAEARLTALRTQINPHFLFNSLNALLVLIRDSDTKTAERMLELLSELLRQVLTEDARQEVTLEEELRFLDGYLAIAQIRFSDRLRIVQSVDPGLSDALVPQFILQPLVENALRHGIGESVAGGTIEISARRDGDDLVLSVTDDGPGIAAAPNGTGVGLRNTRERIATLYGDRGLLVLAARPTGGTIATVRLPYHRASQAPAA
ncbi:MAG TPA: histidine kinase [Gemmatimonadaceae bacterium]|nr:histidine kinase [Gemmatimonadaceae bacterium]